MKKSYYIIWVTLLLILPAVSFAQEISQSFSGIKKIKMSVASGDCIMKKSAGKEVGVYLKHSFGDGYSPTIEKKGDELIIKENLKGSYSGSAKWILNIPDGVDVKVNTGSGDMEAEGLKVNLKMNTGSGNLSLSKMSGDFNLNTGSGDLLVSEFSGDIRANTGSGSIEGSKLLGSVMFNCGSGSISVKESQAMFKVNVGSGNVDASGIELNGESSFSSGSGDTEVELSASLQYDISLSSGSGDAHLDFNGNKIEGLVVMEANKHHGEIKAPFKFDSIEEKDQGHDQTIVKKTALIGRDKVKINISTGSGTASIK